MRLNTAIRHKTLFHKLIFTVFIILVYLLGRSLPLYGVDISTDYLSDIDMSTILIQSISGDRYEHSVLTLGIFPFMISSLSVQIVMALLSKETKNRISQVTVNNISLLVMFLVAVVQSLVKVNDMRFIYTDADLSLAKGVAVVEMIAGAFVILYLSDRNSKYGVGGQTALIYINIIDSLITVFRKTSISKLIIPIIISIFIIVVVVTMENAEKRIPLKRVAIHSIYADKNYMAIKLNPIGIMPVMFSSAMFMLLQVIVSFIVRLFPDVDVLIWIESNMVLDEIFGIIIYIGVLYFLTIMMSLVFISPRDLTEQFLKSGDCIINLHAGEDTYRYLLRNILIMSIISATIMGVCIILPMLLTYFGVVDKSLSVIPSSFMMLTGIFYNLYQEIITIKNFDEYRPLI